MKRIFITLTLLLSALGLWAQENSITLSGGYCFGNIESLDEGTTGWRINGLYEFTPYEGNFSHGFSFGYISTNVTVNETPNLESELKSGHLPLYYVPKYSFGQSESFRPFVKGALGMHFSSYDYDLPLAGNIETGDAGFYGGLGAGIAFIINTNVIINLEYEWAYLSNSWYRNGSVSSAMLGVGLKF